MNRRISIAAALFLTTVAGFIITTYGSQNGLFGGGDAAEQPVAQALATDTAVPAPTAPPPQVVEQVVYRDEYVRVPAPAGSGNPAPGADNGTGSSGAPPPPAPGTTGTTAPPQPTAASVPTAIPQPTNPPPAGGNVQAIDLQGTVSAVGNGTFTVSGTSRGAAVISTNSSTTWEGGQFGNLTAWTRVEVKVLAAGGSQPTGPNGTWLAVHVHMED